MEISNTYNQINSGSTSKTRKDIVDKDVFLKLLTVQLSQQDPLNPKDNTEYIAQLAQFTTLEQTQNLNKSIGNMLLSQKITEGSMLIGREVEFRVDDNQFIKDTVKSVKVEGTDVYLITKNDERYKIDQVTELNDYTSAEQISGQAGDNTSETGI